MKKLAALSILTLTALVLWAPTADAYDRYSVDGNDTNCRSCHGDFRANPYVSLKDGMSWGDDAHDVHRRVMVSSDCSTCHGGTFFPVLIGSSAGGVGFPAIGCVGCHGREEDNMAPNPDVAFGQSGRGAGLRQHHFNAGVMECAGCHEDADPANYMTVGEDVPPPYYFTPDANHPDKPTDSCSLNGEEDYAAAPIGLDNDGNLDYDGDDAACMMGCMDDAECDNGEFCDGAETCDVGTGECVPGTPLDTDDGVPCTDDSCDEVNDVVVNAPNDGLCDNGEFCDGVETCDAVNDCQVGTSPDVDDGVPCTDDSCDEVNDVVVNAPNDGNCDNGEFCDGAETCDAVNDCQGGAPPCDPATESCDETLDVCDPLGCQSDADCDNGQFCDGAETCDALGDCQPGTPPDTDDGVPCTDDSCDEVNDAIVNAPNDGNCDNGEFCDGAETCDAVNDCQGGVPPCDPATESCDETLDVCDPLGCQSDADCDNGQFCDGAETCDALGECQPGTPPDTDDGVPCTDDSCDEVNDAIVNAPNDGNCDNGEFCDGAETCDAVNDCQAGTPPGTDDGVACTDDSCDEVNDVVVNAPNDGLCPDDGLFCTGEEICDAFQGCVSTDDPCLSTGGVCDEDADMCMQVGGKMTICHIPPGNPDQAKTKSVGADAVEDHLGHGDSIGPCPPRDL